MEDLLSVCPEEEEFSLGNFLKEKVARGVIQGYKSWTVPHILAIIPCPDHELNREDIKDFFLIDPALWLEDGASQLNRIRMKLNFCSGTSLSMDVFVEMMQTFLLWIHHGFYNV